LPLHPLSFHVGAASQLSSKQNLWILIRC